MVERVDDLYLPLATVNRFIKSNLPEGVALSKEARLAVSRAASIFVLYCTAAANNIAQHADRRTILPNDVLGALHDMDYGEFIKPLQAALDDFKKNNSSAKSANSDNAAGGRTGSSASASGGVTKKKPGPKPGLKKKVTSDVTNNSKGRSTTPGGGAASGGSDAVIDLDRSGDDTREGEPAHIDDRDLAVRPPDDDDVEMVSDGDE